MGFGDSIRDAINKATNATPIAKAMSGTTAGTTSGLDAAMQAHADQQHPVPQASRVRRRADGSVVLMGDADY